ncbi:MAG: general secretion pathway protein GspK [Planctomycetes bacterium]|nr:general secretion pathway protein GspK [Planctomycetota bacterium]
MNKRGVILLLSFILLSLLIILIAQLSTVTASNKVASGSYLKRLQMDYSVNSMYYYALEYLILDNELDGNKERIDNDADFMAEPWAIEEGIKKDISIGKDENAQMTAKIKDCARYININYLLDADGKVNQSVHSILTKLFKDKLINLQVDRFVDYMTNKTGYFFIFDELKNIEGVTEEILYGADEKKGLVEYITLWPIPVKKKDKPDEFENRDGWKINLNTASEDVIFSLHENMTEAAKTALVNFRQKTQDYKGKNVPEFYEKDTDIDAALQEGGINISDPNNQQLVEELKKRSAFFSNAFYIEIESKIGKTLKSKTFVVELKKQQGQPLPGQANTAKIEKVISFPTINYKFPKLEDIENK